MAQLIREVGRYLRRERLRWMRRLSTDKRHWNSALSYREFWQGRLRLSAYPRMIQLGATMACNLRCFFCQRTIQSVRERHARLASRLDREIPPAVVEQVLRFMPYVEIFDLTPFGENFLYSNFDRLLEHHARLDCRNMTMTTAGTLIGPERAELIVRAGVQQVKISLEETDPDRYAEMRRGAQLDRVIEGIRLLQECKERRRSAVPRLTLAASYMLRNIERLPEMVRFAAAQGVPEIYVQMLELKYHDDAEVRKEELTYHVPLLRRMIAEGEAEAKRLGVAYVVTYPIYALLQAGESKETDAEARSAEWRKGRATDADSDAVARLSRRARKRLIEKCTNPWWWAYIDENGYLWPCCWAKVNFGNLREKPFMEVWNSDVAQDMRRRFLADDIPPYCRGQLCHVDIEESP